MEGRVVRLHHYQTYDPARGSFMVHPMAVMKDKRRAKEVTVGYDEDGKPIRHTVFRAANHIVRHRYTREIVTVEPHPEAIDFVEVLG